MLSTPSRELNRQCHSISFIDDMLSPLICSANMLVEQIQDMIAILHTHAIMFQLSLDYKVGKTQPMIKFRGTPSRKTWS